MEAAALPETLLPVARRREAWERGSGGAGHWSPLPVTGSGAPSVEGAGQAAEAHGSSINRQLVWAPGFLGRGPGGAEGQPGCGQLWSRCPPPLPCREEPQGDFNRPITLVAAMGTFFM